MTELTKFQDPHITAKGEVRAYVDLQKLKTLWFNTGSLCNLACSNCYIESSPKNDRLSFINAGDVRPFLDEIKTLSLPVDLIGFTGGEPFANPHMIDVLKEVLGRGHEVLLLTNAYKAIKKYHQDLIGLQEIYSNKLKIRVSLDHYTKEVHESERGQGTFDDTIQNLKWLVGNGFSISIAGRSLIKEPLDTALSGYRSLMKKNSIALDLKLGANIVIFPEMNASHDVPEISTGCWDILKQSPEDQMCSSERMIVKNKEDGKLAVMPCTLLAYDKQFNLGPTLLEAQKRVYLNHPFCAKFCVLGGASCSAAK
jgi:sulfatase maturation enzyme AslB (radical SAM superfamily)